MSSNETGRYTIRAHECALDKNKGFTIVPFGDIHYNAPMHAKTLFRAYCRELAARIKKGESMYFLGVGDYLETFSASETKAMAGNLHESSRTIIDRMVESACDELLELLAFSNGRWLGLLGGNHTHQSDLGITTTDYLSQRLGAGEGLGGQTAMRLFFARTSSSGIHTLDLRAHHGRGGGQLAGSTFNALEKFAAGRLADLYIMGHDHRLGAIPGQSRLELYGPRENLRERATTPWYIRCGSFLKGYVPGKVSYATERALPPLPIGTVEVRVTLSRTRIPGADGDVREVKPQCSPTVRVFG